MPRPSASRPPEGPSAARAGRKVLLLALLVAVVAAASPMPDTGLATGESLYVRGVLPSGAPLVGQRADGTDVSGASAACARCHRRSGLGAIEGRISIPPISAPYLFSAPGLRDGSAPPVVGTMRIHRPPYTTATLARALREGVGADGRTLDYLMPRFALDDAAQAALVAYLRSLGAEAAPGVSDDTLHFATVITPDSDPVKRAAMLAVLTRYFEDQNAAYRNTSRPVRSTRAVSYRVARRWVLHVWTLTGAPQGWEAQLRSKLAREPVFAVVSGLGGRDWSPVHRFCEAARLPCLFPNVEAPATRPDDAYTLYFSAGVRLEAALVAHALGEEPPARVIQVLRDGDVGDAAAGELEHALQDRHVTVVTRRLPATGGDLPAAVATEPVDGLVLWLRGADLERLRSTAPGSKAVYVSGLMGDPDGAPLGGAWREAARVAYPFDLPDARRARVDYQVGWFAARSIPLTSLQVQSDTFLACGLVAEAVSHMGDAFQRPYLLERLDDELGHRILTGYYRHLSLGIGQRFASKGGYLLRFDAGTGGAATLAGDWIVP